MSYYNGKEVALSNTGANSLEYRSADDYIRLDLVPRPGLEPGTFWVSIRCYYQLSYLGIFGGTNVIRTRTSLFRGLATLAKWWVNRFPIVP